MQHYIHITTIEMATTTTCNNNNVVELEREAPIHGDILEAIFSHVPLIHLVPASHVSTTWKRTVSSSLRHVNPAKPWLTVHTQNPRAPHVTITFAYDPRSSAWLQLHAPHQPYHSSSLRASHSSLLYTLSASELAFSLDPLRLTWHHAPPPRVSRTDPVVARVGKRVVVAGGACDFEDDPLAVEVYDLESRAWLTCESMPELLKGSTASTWLSVAVAGEKMHVTEKNSGLTYTFDCDTMKWEGPYDVRFDENVSYCVTGTIRGRLIVVGIMGDAENVKLWEVKGELGLGSELGVLGSFPKEMLAKVVGEDDDCDSSIEVNWMGDYVYFWNRREPEEMVVWEFGSEGCEWGCVKNMVVNDETLRMGRMVFCGGYVGFEELECAVRANCRFVEKVST